MKRIWFWIRLEHRIVRRFFRKGMKFSKFFCSINKFYLASIYASSGASWSLCCRDPSTNIVREQVRIHSIINTVLLTENIYTSRQKLFRFLITIKAILYRNKTQSGKLFCSPIFCKSGLLCRILNLFNYKVTHFSGGEWSLWRPEAVKSEYFFT